MERLVSKQKGRDTVELEPRTGEKLMGVRVYGNYCCTQIPGSNSFRTERQIVRVGLRFDPRLILAKVFQPRGG